MPNQCSKVADFRLAYFKRKTGNAPLEFFSGPDDVIEITLDLPQLWRHCKTVGTQNFPCFF